MALRLLFMCVANSARSQLAESIGRAVFGTNAEIRSAGSLPTQVNPLALAALKEKGLPTGDLESKSIDDLPAEFLSRVDYVITLCSEEVCPTVVATGKRLGWALPDPAGHRGTINEQMQRFRDTRDELEKRIREFARHVKSS